MPEIKYSRIGLSPPCLLIKTGQTTQYDSKEDDGYFEKGVSKSYAVLTAGQFSGTVDIVLNSKTHALSNNCVIDKRTGLMWARYVPDGDIGPDSDGELLGLDDTNDEDIYDFKDQANTKELGGYSDWRVPNIPAIATLGLVLNDPSIDQTVFPSTPADFHWSSTTRTDLTNKAYVWSFFKYYGLASHVKEDIKNYCRLVRGPFGGEI